MSPTAQDNQRQRTIRQQGSKFFSKLLPGSYGNHSTYSWSSRGFLKIQVEVRDFRFSTSKIRLMRLSASQNSLLPPDLCQGATKSFGSCLPVEHLGQLVFSCGPASADNPAKPRLSLKLFLFPIWSWGRSFCSRHLIYMCATVS